MWKEDRYHGAGILIASNKYHFSGDFVNGERTVSSEADIHTHYVCDVCMCVLCNNSTATGIIGMCQIVCVCMLVCMYKCVSVFVYVLACVYMDS